MKHAPSTGRFFTPPWDGDAVAMLLPLSVRHPSLMPPQFMLYRRRHIVVGNKLIPIMNDMMENASIYTTHELILFIYVQCTRAYIYCSILCMHSTHSEIICARLWKTTNLHIHHQYHHKHHRYHRYHYRSIRSPCTIHIYQCYLQ